MDFNDEKDYIMRIIKEMVRVLFSLMLGKQYKSVELPEENKYEVSGKALEEFEKMVDAGLINEAENVLLESIDYTNMVKSLRCLWKPNHALFPKTEYRIKRQPLQEPQFLKLFQILGEVLGHTLAGIGVSLGLSMNFEAVTVRYVDVRRFWHSFFAVR